MKEIIIQIIKASQDVISKLHIIFHFINMFYL